MKSLVLIDMCHQIEANPVNSKNRMMAKNVEFIFLLKLIVAVTNS